MTMTFRRAKVAGLIVSALLAPAFVAAAAPAHAIGSFSGSYFNPKGKFAGSVTYSSRNGYWGVTDMADGYHVVAKLQASQAGSPFYTYSTKTLSDGHAGSWYAPLPSTRGTGRIQVCFYNSSWNPVSPCDYVAGGLI